MQLLLTHFYFSLQATTFLLPSIIVFFTLHVSEPAKLYQAASFTALFMSSQTDPLRLPHDKFWKRLKKNKDRASFNRIKIKPLFLFCRAQYGDTFIPSLILFYTIFSWIDCVFRCNTNNWGRQISNLSRVIKKYSAPHLLKFYFLHGKPSGRFQSRNRLNTKYSVRQMNLHHISLHESLWGFQLSWDQSEGWSWFKPLLFVIWK